MGAPHTRLSCLLPALLGAPVAAGLLTTLLGAAGIVPGLAGGPSVMGWRILLDWPGLPASVALTLRIGVAATLLSTVSALLLAAAEGPVFRALRAGVVPILAMPHAAVAIGVGFLVSPTGLLVRLAGFGHPLPFATVGDSGGWAVVLSLWLKETPFLLLMAWSGLAQAEVAPTLRAGASLGQSRLRSWAVGVLPRLWPQLRLPVAAVLAFSLSGAEVAVVLGPQTPPTLAVAVLRWSLDPDIAHWPAAAAGAVLLTALMLGCLGIAWGLEGTVAAAGRIWARRGGGGAGAPEPAAFVVAAVVSVVGIGAMAALLGWAGAGSWRFPATLPEGWSATNVASRVGGLAGPAGTTLWLGAVATLISVLVCVASLCERAAVRDLVWLPLILPQTGFLFGVQTLLVAADLDGSAVALVWAHLLFVLPYVMLALAGPWRALDPRYGRVAASLGATPMWTLVRVTLPLLARPIAVAAAVGFAVSVGLYLPTLFAGAGRIATLATEAVTLSAGSDRRILAATALAQAALPWAAFAVAAAWRG